MTSALLFIAMREAQPALAQSPVPLQDRGAIRSKESKRLPLTDLAPSFWRATACNYVNADWGTVNLAKNWRFPSRFAPVMKAPTGPVGQSAGELRRDHNQFNSFSARCGT